MREPYQCLATLMERIFSVTNSRFWVCSYFGVSFLSISYDHQLSVVSIAYGVHDGLKQHKRAKVISVFPKTNQKQKLRILQFIAQA